MHNPNDNLLNGELRRFKTYPTYKSSGVEWLGDIPAGWGVNRLKEVATIQMSNVDKKSVDGEDEVELCNYTDVYYNDRITPDMPFMKATAPREQVRRFALRAGDVLITKDSESWTDIAVPAVVVADMPNVLCGYHLAHIRPKTAMDGVYLSRAIAAVGPRDQFRVAANGVTRFAIGTEAVTTAVFAVPPLSEQRAIAAFLDRETARIDALVARKERLITLLQERRAALITRAVTKGLNPAVPMKDSGVVWLGEVPAHWEVRRLKLLLDTPLKYGANESAELEDPELPRYVRITDIDDKDGLRDETFKSLPRDVAAPYLLQEGDLLFARSGATAGKSFLYRQSWGVCAYAGYLIRARLRTRDVSPNYVRYVTASSYYWIWLSATFIQATIQNVSAEKYANLMVPMPPLAEQRAISELLDRHSSEIDEMITRIRAVITRLNEFRTALISAAVTGKIDVRETAQ
jgi:type I restriction enzyme S subunit